MNLERIREIGKMGELAPSATLELVAPSPECDAGLECPRSQGMDGIRDLLATARDDGLAAARFRGLLHVAIGRRITKSNGTIVSNGITWRQLAALLKDLQFDRNLARNFGVDPTALAPRDRERFWYSVIALARVDSPEASAEADALAGELKKRGYLIGPNPSVAASRKDEPAAKSAVKKKKK